MNKFKSLLKSKFYDSLYNHYGESNYDVNRYGSFPDKFKNKYSLLRLIKDRFKQSTKFKNDITDGYFENSYEKFLPYEKEFLNLLQKLSDKDIAVYIELLTYRILGFDKVKLYRNNPTYWNTIKSCEKLANKDDYVNANFASLKLHQFDLNNIGYPLSIYYKPVGIATQFVIEQYAYKKDNTSVISVEEGDYVLDLGGCWGDTAHYFAAKTEGKGKVFCFEFIPGNIEIFRKNLSLNPNLSPLIDIVEHPVSDVSDVEVYYKDNGPGSIIKDKPFSEQTGSVKTLSIDDFVERNTIEKVDFIKMDIEGSETKALEGALKTIKKFKPKLAIAIYHSLEEMVMIPNWILNLDLGYEIYIDHYTINVEETICFARVKK